jgi:hypothetical protein
MITGYAAWILVIVVMSTNKAGYEILTRSGYMNEESCLYEKEDALQVKSTVVAECVSVSVEK